MKKTIKIMIAICLLSFVHEVSAQSLGAKLGLNLSGTVWRNNNGSIGSNNQILPGFHLGASFDYPFKFSKIPDLLIAAEAGFLFESKGFGVNTTIITLTNRTTYSLYYLDFPLVVRAGYDLGPVKVYGMVGFWLGVGVYGEIVSITSNNASKRDIRWGGDSNNHDIRPLDFGLIFGLGTELNSIPLRFELVFNLGLANLAVYQGQSTYLANRTFAISAGYRFLDFSK